MASVTFPSSLGGDNSTVTDDSNATTGLANGGHRTRFVPALSQTVTVMNGGISAAQTQVALATSQVALAAAQVALATTQASNAATSAASAALSAGATVWVSGTTYAIGDTRYSPITNQVFRRKTAGAGTTDPSLDATNWGLVLLDAITNYPSIRPSLNLDFANSKTLDPRVTFTRASTATYYDGKTVSKAEENLLTYSQDFDNAAWVKLNTTVTANSFAAPDGTTTADTLGATGANSTTLQTYTALAQPYVFSVWLYRVAGTGNVDITVDGTTWVTQSLTAGWNLFSTALTPSAGSKTAGVRIVTSGDSIYIWGAQLEQRSTVTAYTPTTTTPITNYIPVLQTAAANTARFDHNPVTGESLGLLVEEQRTNLLTYSEQFDNAAWMKSLVSTTANTAIAPDGTQTAEKLFVTNGSGSGGAHTYQIVNKAASPVTYTFSVFAKAGEKDGILLLANGTSGADNIQVRFSLITGLVTSGPSSTGSSPFTAGSASISSVGNGWYRVVLKFTTNSDATVTLRIYPRNADGASYTGDGFSGIYIWGAQLESGAFPTSYIPTTTAQVTRNSDSASITGANFSSWHRADEGTIYAEAATTAFDVSRVIFEIGDGTLQNRYSVGRAGSGTSGYIYVETNNITQATQSMSDTFPSGVFGKVSGVFKTNDVIASGNGLLSTADTSVILPFVDRARIGATTTGQVCWSGCIKKIAYYPKRLTNTELQAITV